MQQLSASWFSNIERGHARTNGRRWEQRAMGWPLVNRSVCLNVGLAVQPLAERCGKETTGDAQPLILHTGSLTRIRRGALLTAAHHFLCHPSNPHRILRFPRQSRHIHYSSPQLLVTFPFLQTQVCVTSETPIISVKPSPRTSHKPPSSWFKPT